MFSAWKRAVAAGCCLVASGLVGCHEEPAPERYPENLGDEERRLLPTPPGRYAPGIRKGRARVVEPGESAPGGETAGRPGGASTLPADHWGSVLAKLITGSPGPGGPAGPAVTAAPGDRGGRGRGAPPPSTIPLKPEDEAAIREVFEQYRKANAEARYGDTAQYLVQEQRRAAEKIATPVRKLAEALMDLKDDFGESAPQTAAVAGALLTQLTAVGELESIRMVDPDRAVGRVQTMPVAFERKADAWYLHTPEIPPEEKAEEVANLFRDATGKVEEILDGLDAEELNDAAAVARMQQIIQELQARLTPILMQSAAAIGG